MDSRTKFIYATKYGSLTFSEDSDFWITDFQGISGVNIEAFSSQSPKQIGATLTGQSIQPRHITVEGCIFGDVEMNRAELINVVIPGEEATLTMIPPTGEEWYLKVIPKQTPEIELGEGAEEFQMTLFAPYPCWQTVDSQIQQVGQITPLFKFRFPTGGKWWISKRNTEKFKVVENFGNIPVGFDIRIYAEKDCTNPQITHVETGLVIAFNMEMKAGDSVFISTIQKQEKVTLHRKDTAAENGFRFLSNQSDLTMKLLPGANTLHFDAATQYDGLNFIIIAPKGVRTGI